MVPPHRGTRPLLLGVLHVRRNDNVLNEIQSALDMCSINPQGFGVKRVFKSPWRKRRKLEKIPSFLLVSHIPLNEGLDLIEGL
ncbi:MAG: hypothetical protein CMH69_03265 [Nitratireductor sp.]|nr:hypothetical protein [Nitratireductor sp.]